jgi:hypothetical protein
VGLDQNRESPKACRHCRDLLRKQDRIRARNRANQSGARNSRPCAQRLAEDRRRRIAGIPATVRSQVEGMFFEDFSDLPSPRADAAGVLLEPLMPEDGKARSDHFLGYGRSLASVLHRFYRFLEALAR